MARRHSGQALLGEQGGQIIIDYSLYELSMDDSLKCLSYNCHGLNTIKADYLREISGAYDLVLLQETWLYEDSNFFDEHFPGFTSYAVSGMDASKVNYGRPFGGCCILWKEDLLVSVIPVSTTSERVCAVTIKNNDYDIMSTCHVTLVIKM